MPTTSPPRTRSPSPDPTDPDFLLHSDLERLAQAYLAADADADANANADATPSSPNSNPSYANPSFARSLHTAAHLALHSPAEQTALVSVPAHLLPPGAAWLFRLQEPLGSAAEVAAVLGLEAGTGGVRGVRAERRVEEGDERDGRLKGGDKGEEVEFVFLDEEGKGLVGERMCREGVGALFVRLART